VEIYQDRIRYFDLEIDVIEDVEGNRRIIDEDKLEKAVETGRINKNLEKKALEVAESLVS
jgi:predicted RNA-binding protein associated with RNAse of E/G family